MANFFSLPSRELAQKRRRNCKPLLIALSGLITGLIYPIFAYRHRDKNIIISYLSIAAFIVIFRGIFPVPPIRGTFIFPIINWVIYSKYGPALIHIVSVWVITSSSKTAAKLSLLKPLQNEQDAFHLSDRKTKGILRKLFNLDTKIVNEIYKEASEAATSDQRDTPSIDDLNKVLMDEYDQYGTKPVQFCKINGLRVIPEKLIHQAKVDKKSQKKLIKKSFKKSNKAEIKFETDDYEGSIEEAKKALELEPNNIQALVYLSFSKSSLEDYSGAIESAEKGLEIEPENENFYYILSRSKRELEEYKGALKDIKKAIKLRTDFGEYYSESASIKHLLKDYNGAIRDYTKAIKLDPEISENFKGRGLSKDWSGDLQGALSDWEKAVKLGDEELKEWIEEKKEENQKSNLID